MRGPAAGSLGRTLSRRAGSASSPIPIDTFKTTWAAGFGHEFSAPIDFVLPLEILAVAVGVIATIALLCYSPLA